MRTTNKPNCRTGQLGSGGISFARRYLKLTTQLFMSDGISDTDRSNDPVTENQTGVILYMGGNAMATLLFREVTHV